MKKIFIPVITLLAVSFAAPSYSRWGDKYYNMNHQEGSLFDSDSDSYWLNRLRGYRKYPINYYSESMINKDADEQTQTVDVHEYQRGVAVTARLGQRMYDSTTYTITKKSGGERYQATTDGLLYGGLNEIKIKKGDLFTPFGEVKINGNYFMLLELPNSPYIAMVDTKGRFLDALGMVEAGYLYVSKDITIVRPNDFHVEEYRDVQEITGDTQFNFEIKYGGIENNNMVFLVSSANNSGNEQRMYAPMEQRMLQINDVNFEVIHASPDYIEYKIM